jgi:hypothetical protein
MYYTEVMKLPLFISKRQMFFSNRKKIFQNIGFFALFSIVLVPFLGYAVSFYDQDVVWRESLRIKDAIADDAKYVEMQTDEISRIPDVFAFVKRKDERNLLSVLNDEAKKRKLSGIIATGSDGVVIVRTFMVADRGDYLFDTDPVGRKLAKKEETTSIEKLMAWPLGIESGHLITKNGETVGAIIGKLFLDDEYAQTLKEKHLSKGAELIFYSHEDGIIGATFDLSQKQTLKASLNTGTRWISWVDRGYTFKIGNNDYIAKTITLSGVEEEVGKAVVFYPLHRTLASAISGLTAAFLFLVFFVGFYYVRKKNRNRSFFLISFVCGFLIFGAVFFFTAFLWNQNIITVAKTPYTIYNAVLGFEPSSGLFSMESEHRIAIRAVMGGEVVNAVNIQISYNPAEVEINDIITVNSFCDPDLFLEKSVDKKNGKIKIACGTKFPGFAGVSGTIAELEVQPLGAGETSFQFDDGTRVLASDGLGTDVLRQAIGGSYQFVESQKKPGDASITVYSPTHPNAERWYNKDTVRFTWKTSDGSRYVYSLDKEIASTRLFRNSTTKSGEVIFSNVPDGIYYFHMAKIQNTDEMPGPVTVQKIMIDTTPPITPMISTSEPSGRAGQVERIEFLSKDAQSGLQKNFYVKFNGGVFLPLTSPLLIAYPKGHHTLVVRAFDNAGNYSENSLPINAY